MDIATHAATGVLLSTAFDDPLAKGACILASVIPDISLLPKYLFVYQREKDINIVKHIRSDYPFPERFYSLYRWAHSFVPLALFFGIGLIFQSQIILAFCLGHLSHILWDIPTHTNKFACRPLYPFSSKKLEGFGDWWTSKKGVAFVGITWTFLGIGAYAVFVS